MTLHIDKSTVNILNHLRDACKACRMCRLGRIQHNHNGQNLEDPHVFSNMNFTRLMVVGQNPGYNEVIKDEPFVGDAGEFFNKTIQKYGLNRDIFYITNVVRAHTPDNRQPEPDEIAACSPFLEIELRTLKPILVVTLGAIAFNTLCPSLKFSDNLGKIVKSKYDVNVYPVYHPSPRNMIDNNRRKKFDDDIRILCKLIKQIINQTSSENLTTEYVLSPDALSSTSTH